MQKIEVEDLQQFEELFECPVQKMNTTATEIPNDGSGPGKLLFNFGAPCHINKRERPVHRLMTELAAKGYTNKEIAEMTGRTTVNVNNAVRQPHAQEGLIENIQRQVSEDHKVVEVIKNNVHKAVKLYERALNGDKDVTAVQMEAAERFLNRRYGKPNQPINRGSDVDLNSLSDAELAKMAVETQTTTNK